MIELRTALNEMEAVDQMGNPIPFNIEFVTANEATGEGGEIKRYVNAIMLSHNHHRVNKGKKIRQIKSSRKRANHWRNATRNIQLKGDNRIRKINIWLITQFNDEPVVYNIHG